MRGAGLSSTKYEVYLAIMVESGATNPQLVTMMDSTTGDTHHKSPNNQVYDMTQGLIDIIVRIIIPSGPMPA